uniref:Uncharacterized protein n=1 Tax=Manihot esculenta TaxID=3983 RepID=A0A2C9WB07_MANES
MVDAHPSASFPLPRTIMHVTNFHKLQSVTLKSTPTTRPRQFGMPDTLNCLSLLLRDKMLASFDG